MRTATDMFKKVNKINKDQEEKVEKKLIK